MRRSALTTLLLLAGGSAAAALGASRSRDAASPGGTTSASDSTTAPPTARTPRVERVRLATGVTLQYAVQGDPSGTPVILLHGYSDSWLSFDRVLPLLPRTLHVFALSQRGHGDSERPPEGYSMESLAADVVAFMDAQSLPRAVVVGHSMGSFVAQQVAATAPRRVERLVLIGSATTPRAIMGVAELRGAVESFGDSVPDEFIREFQWSTVNQAPPAAFMERAIAESRKMPPRVWQRIMSGMMAMDPPDALLGVRIPTLLLWGERDAVFAGSEQQALLRRIPGSRLRAYPAVGHAPHWEVPLAFARDLERFVLSEGQ
ncbi:MAG TPA: alpha/beta hydrolase [Gemmatimonadaceae bacterium]|nr:alpha/beta hydrolase [Gemmatimonadaceae bacterium]